MRGVLGGEAIIGGLNDPGCRRTPELKVESSGEGELGIGEPAIQSN